jgi:hypothetical protein
MLRKCDGWVNPRVGAFLVIAACTFQSRDFSTTKKNKIPVFSCRNENRFLISSRWQGAKIVGVNNM